MRTIKPLDKLNSHSNFVSVKWLTNKIRDQNYFLVIFYNVLYSIQVKAALAMLIWIWLNESKLPKGKVLLNKVVEVIQTLEHLIIIIVCKVDYIFAKFWNFTLSNENKWTDESNKFEKSPARSSALAFLTCLLISFRFNYFFRGSFNLRENQTSELGAKYLQVVDSDGRIIDG